MLEWFNAISCNFTWLKDMIFFKSKNYLNKFAFLREKEMLMLTGIKIDAVDVDNSRKREGAGHAMVVTSRS